MIKRPFVLSLFFVALPVVAMVACDDPETATSNTPSAGGASGKAGAGAAAGTGGASGAAAGSGGASGAAAGSGGASGAAAGSGGASGAAAGTGGSSGAAAGSGGSSGAAAGKGGASGAAAGSGGATGGAAGGPAAGAGGAAGKAGSGGAAAGSGSGGAAGVNAGGASGSGAIACPESLSVPSVPDACVSDADCVLAEPLAECCGPIAHAVPANQLASWNTAAATYNACKCPQPTPCDSDGTAGEDGTTPSAAGASPTPVARCRGNVCVGSYLTCDAPPAPSRACVTAADCSTVLVQTDCCKQRLFGVASADAGNLPDLWSAYRPICVGTCEDVKCALPEPEADDGTKQAPNGDKVQIACVDKVCTTTFPK